MESEKVNFYRNQTSTNQKIQMLASLNITTIQEAVAFLRAQQTVNAQIVTVLQKAGLAHQQSINRVEQAFAHPAAKAAMPVEDTPEPEAVKSEVPAEEIETREEFSENEVKTKVAILKKAKKKTSKTKE